MTKDKLQEIWRVLQAVSQEDRARVFEQLRKEFPIHSLEKEWNVSANLILEAINRSSDLTKRGVRGVIAEAMFEQSVVKPLTSLAWKDITPKGDHPYDFLLADESGSVKVQVKMQRLEKRIPKLWSRGSNFFVVETQKTRTGTNSAGSATRPYHFGEFDILAVCMHPSCGDWRTFRYTIANWLLPRPNADNQLIRVYQPVPASSNADWCDDFVTAVQWLRGGAKRTIYEPPKR